MKNKKNNKKTTKLVVIKNGFGCPKGRNCEINILPMFIRKAA